MHEQTGQLAGTGGVKIHFRHFKPTAPRGSMVIAHGANEHGGHYEHVAQYFVAQGLQVFVIDHRGHGCSEGVRCHVNRFDEYLSDLDLLIAKASESGKPTLVGHSMGGLISFHYALRHPDRLAGLVLSSPWFGLRVKVPAVQRTLGTVASFVRPKLSMPLAFPMENVTRNLAMVERKKQDPLFARTFTPRWFLECEAATQAAHAQAHTLAVPVLMLQAADDLLVDPGATRAVYEKIPAGRKSFELLTGKYHEIFNDDGYDEIFSSILNWMNKQELARPT